MGSIWEAKTRVLEGSGKCFHVIFEHQQPTTLAAPGDGWPAAGGVGHYR